MYCATLWSNFTVKSFNSLKVCYNNSLRMLLNMPRYCSASSMFLNSGLPTFQEFRRKSVYSVMLRLQASENSLIKCVVNKCLPESRLCSLCLI